MWRVRNIKKLLWTFTSSFYCTDKSKGFAFVEYVEEDDAFDALDNMDGSELFGKVLRCNVAKALPKAERGKAIWNAEEWIQNKLNPEGDDAVDDNMEVQSLVPTN